MNNKEDKMVDRLHLIYLSILFGAAIVFVISMYYGAGTKAGEMLSFSATLSSILLALIAIVMTIVDVAGQRNTVVDLKETAEKLENNLIKAGQGIAEINSLKEELLNSMDGILKSNLAVSKEIADLKAKYSKNENAGAEQGDTQNKEILVDLNNLSEKMKNVSVAAHFRGNRFIHGHQTYTINEQHAEQDKEITFIIRDFLKRNFMKDVQYEFSEFYSSATNIGLPITRSRLKHEINRLVNLRAIKRVNGKYYKIINII
jgi:hypothetical protein